MTASRLSRIACAVLVPLAAAAPCDGVTESPFRVVSADSGTRIRSLRRAGDPDGVEFLRRGCELGEVTIRYRFGTEPWRELPPGGRSPDLSLQGTFAPEGDALSWALRLKNTSGRTMDVGDIALPLPMNTQYEPNREETFVRRVFKHAFIAGAGSFLYWLPVKGTGAILVMMPREGTSLEYFTEADTRYDTGGGRFTVFIRSSASGAAETHGTWRQPHTGQVLAPGEEATYGFAFRWADSYQGVRDLLFEHGGCDVRVAPGMVIPQDQQARIALRTKRTIDAVQAEFPADTRIEAGPGGVYAASFSRPGENKLTVRFAGGGTMPLEFYATAPLETLIRQRAAFIAGRQQHRDPAKWYDGLFSLWDSRLPAGRNLLGPDNLGGQPPYAVSGSDDPSNSKGLLLSEKNVAYPDAREIEALEYYLKNFVWGRQQRTDKESPHPFGIYGSDSWRECRASRTGLSSGGHGQERMWRTFDYTTYFALYYNMYRIARQNPRLVRYLDAAGYLERAAGTARAYFEVPYSIHMHDGWAFTGWCDWAYKVGNFHEKYLLRIIAALEQEGRADKAAWLRGEWEKKVKYFLYDEPWPFASEMPIDSTAYESSYAIGKHALTRELKPDENLWQDKNSGTWYSHPSLDPQRSVDYLRRQHMANLACRGVLEANYWSLGSDFRGCGSASYTLSYMSQMGGWAILDYALRFDPRPADNLRLGYASLLSSWALVRDGAASWGFQPRKVGTEWNQATRDLPRGPWPVDGEIDHGLTAGIEAACTVVFDDPIFGLIAYGGDVTASRAEIRVTPRDGVRQRLHVLLGDRRLHLALDRDGFAAGKPVGVATDFQSLELPLESRSDLPHTATLEVDGLPGGAYRITTAGGVTESVMLPPAGKTAVALRLTRPEESVTIRRVIP